MAHGFNYVNLDKQMVFAFPELFPLAISKGIFPLVGLLSPESIDVREDELIRTLPSAFGNSVFREARWFLLDLDAYGLMMEDPETGLGVQALLHAVKNGWIP